jgi:hypothetical protein
MPKSFAIMLALLLLALSIAAAAFGAASIYRREAVTVIEKWVWPEDEPGPPAWAWEQVHRYLWLANRLAPFDAQVKSDLGQLYESRVVDAEVKGDPGQLYELRSGEAKSPEASGPEIPASQASTDLETALGFYRQSLALRPAWPQAWADVASLKITQEHIDAEFALALQRALTLGPWESSIQAGIAGGGLTVWDQLPAQLQTDIEHAIQRGLSIGSRLMPLVARRFDLLETSETKPAQATTSNPPPEGWRGELPKPAQ